MAQTVNPHDFYPLRAFDGRRLRTAGYHWYETHYDPMMVAIMIATFAGMAALFIGLMAHGMNRTVDWMVPGTLVAVAVTALLIGSRFFRVQREVVLGIEGDIRLPFGLPDKRKARRMRAHHNDVVSFEARSRPGIGHGVVMILREGSTTWLSRNVTESESLIIAVQLTTALSEMRRTIASDLRAADDDHDHHPAPETAAQVMVSPPGR